MRATSQRRGVALAVAVTLLSTAAVLSPASPSGAAVVANPGTATFTVDLGGFFNIAGRALTLPSAATPTQCSDGINNDTAIDDTAEPPAQQDANIDFDGGAAAGVTPPTANDAQCNGGGAGRPASADDSEVKAGHQPRAYLTVEATVDADGNVSAEVGDITFPAFYVFSKTANGAIDITSRATAPLTGTVDPVTGQVDLQLDWQIEVLQAFFKIGCIAPISMALSTDAGAAANSGPIEVSPSPVDPATGDFTVSGNTFEVGAMVPNPTPPFDPPSAPSLCTTVGSSFGLPAAAEASAAQLAISSSTIFVPPAVELADISGTVTAAVGGAPAPGVTVTLMDKWPAWSVAATTTTDSEGRYSFDELPEGEYQIRFFDAAGRFQRTWFQAKQTYKVATPVVVSAESAVIADQALPAAPTGRIAGRVRDKDDVGIGGVRVNFYSATEGFYASQTTGPLGHFNLFFVPPGEYKVWFTDPEGRYISQWANFKLLGFNADTLVVDDDTTLAGAVLQAKGGGGASS